MALRAVGNCGWGVGPSSQLWTQSWEMFDSGQCLRKAGGILFSFQTALSPLSPSSVCLFNNYFSKWHSSSTPLFTYNPVTENCFWPQHKIKVSLRQEPRRQPALFPCCLGHLHALPDVLMLGSEPGGLAVRLVEWWGRELGRLRNFALSLGL